MHIRDLKLPVVAACLSFSTAAFANSYTSKIDLTSRVPRYAESLFRALQTETPSSPYFEQIPRMIRKSTSIWSSDRTRLRQYLDKIEFYNRIGSGAPGAIRYQKLVFGMIPPHLRAAYRVHFSPVTTRTHSGLDSSAIENTALETLRFEFKENYEALDKQIKRWRRTWGRSRSPLIAAIQGADRRNVDTFLVLSNLEMALHESASQGDPNKEVWKSLFDRVAPRVRDAMIEDALIMDSADPEHIALFPTAKEVTHLLSNRSSSSRETLVNSLAVLDWILFGFQKIPAGILNPDQFFEVQQNFKAAARQYQSSRNALGKNNARELDQRFQTTIRAIDQHMTRHRLIETGSVYQDSPRLNVPRRHF